MNGPTPPPATSSGGAPRRTIKARWSHLWKSITDNAANKIQICILIAIAWQGYEQYRQTGLAQNTASFSILQQLRQETTAIENSIYDGASTFQKAQLDNCQSLTEVPTKDRITVKNIIGHYELYYDAAKLPLITEEEWRGICRGGRDFIDSNCVLKREWESQFPKITSSLFRESFDKCQLIR
jgi:hypothetical protein